MTLYAYLGPPGTFTEEALLSLGLRGIEREPYQSVNEVIAAVEERRADAGVVPIENSIEGSVNETIDTLAFGTRSAAIVEEVVRPIRHALLARDGVRLEEVREVVSHPHATAQCRRWLAQNLPGARIHAANSTAEAVRACAEADAAGGAWAAIGSALAAELYGVSVLARDVEDRHDNRTRFVVLSREQAPPTGADKTSIVCFIEKDRPGSLLAILHEFSDRGINLTKLESRPTKQRLGEYCFFIDTEGHASEPPLRYAIESLRTKILEVKVLGSYPRAADA